MGFCESIDRERIDSIQMINAWCTLIWARYLLKSRNLEQLISLLEARKAKCRRKLTYSEAKRFLYQIQQAKRFLLFRNACLEDSLALFLLSTQKKVAVDWCIGSRLAPFSSHAWIEVEEKPVDEDVGAYQKVIQV